MMKSGLKFSGKARFNKFGQELDKKVVEYFSTLTKSEVRWLIMKYKPDLDAFGYPTKKYMDLAKIVIE